MSNFIKLEKILRINFKNKDLLRQAFVHRSYLNEHSNFKLGHNERMEFLGDAVLELAVTENLFKKFPDEQEGKLTNLRSSLVNTKMLAEIAQELKLGDFLYLSKGEAYDTNKKAKESILANTFEAMVGAIYLDQGFKISKIFLKRVFAQKLDFIIVNELYLDPKSRFQEISQEKHNITPQYKMLDESGPDHEKIFTIGLYIGEELISKGKGASKQLAQFEAAKRGLKKKKWK
ncbi:ribonuclease III [Candidatus Parcubacteria bacterium]|nr:ribonuclease III [Candidatus Parcubacteria bacterium]